LSSNSSSPPAASAPALAAAAKPVLSPICTTRAPGASSATSCGVPSAEPLSATINSSPSRSCSTKGGSVAARAPALFQATMTMESRGSVTRREARPAPG